MSITSVKFTNYKALRDYSISLHRMNVLVGPNNSGKSTILGAFRVLEQALRTARSRRASLVQTHTQHASYGHIISENAIPITLENVHHDYSDSDSRIEFRYSNNNKLILYFPSDGGVTMYWDVCGKSVTTATAFRKAFPEKIQTIPVLGPIEQDEFVVTDETVRKAAGTPRASRHFRNYWFKNPDGFNSFQDLIEKTWPDMSIGKPEMASYMDRRLTMFVSESRIDRELYWSGLGFQIWCQLLTHVSRCMESDVLVVDEPEVYLHPEVQRQLLGILREVNPDILLATHSVEILSEADPHEILLVDKSRRSARRLRDIEGVQQALDNIGSIQNVTLTELARNRRLLFVEGLDDYKIVRRFAKILGYSELAAGNGLTALESGGFESWSRIQALAWGFRNTLGSELKIAAVYDRDYRCDEEVTQLRVKLEKEIQLAHFHRCKEIENYLLTPDVLERAIQKAIQERARRTGVAGPENLNVRSILEKVTQDLKTDCTGQYISKYCDFFARSGKDRATLTSESLSTLEHRWSDLDSRLKIVPGKRVLRAVREVLQNDHGISLTNVRIIDAYFSSEVPQDLESLIRKLDAYRTDG